MKKMLILVVPLCLILTVRAQEPAQNEAKRMHKVHIGLAYGYTHTDMKLLYMKELFTWNQTSSEPRELTGEEMDNMNARETFTRQLQGLTLEAGMVILDKPESNWFIDGNLRVGLAASVYQIQNKQIDTLEMKNTSGLKNPTASLTFNFTYKIAPHWGVAAVPFVNYTYGIDKSIQDHVYGQIQNFTESRKCTYNYLYGRVNLLAVWMIKELKIGFGPGFYVLYNTNDYRINRTNPETRDTYSTQVITHLISKSFIDGNIQIEWKIIPSLALAGFVGVGSDLTTSGSISWYF